MNTDASLIDENLDADTPTGATTSGVAPASPEDMKRADKLLKQIEHTRNFDADARKQYAFCRRYARGDSTFEVNVNLIGTYIDILVAFLYARNPDVDVLVADCVGPSRKKDTRLFAKTLEIVISRLWKQAKMKRQAERWLRSSLTCAVGWLQVGWQETYQTDQVMLARKRDVQENLARIENLEAEIAAGMDDIEDQKADLAAQIKGLEANIEKLVYRGLFIDFVPAEDVQVSMNVQNIIDCDVATWIAKRFYIPSDEAKAKFPLVPSEAWKSTGRYKAKKPTAQCDVGRTAAGDGRLDASSADAFTKGGEAAQGNSFVMGWEMWRADENLIYTLIEGLPGYAKPPEPPAVATTRFYNLFPLALHEVEGERHPQSLVTRSYRLMDEYQRTRSGYAELRRRIKPRMGFDARRLTKGEVEKMTNGTYAEFVPLKPVGDAPLEQSVFELPYPKIDYALFDVLPIKTELEQLWGIQEALTGSIQVAKTATEAEIQQSGTNARTGSMRDRIEDKLTEIAEATAQIAVQKMTRDDVVEIAGPEAVWPEGITHEDLDLLVGVTIRAGSTGKPNTTQQREAWAATLDVVMAGLERIAALRMSNPLDQAQCIENLMEETFARAGDQNIDLARFIPQPGEPMLLVDPITGAQVMAYPAPPEMQPQPAPGAGGEGGGAPAPGGVDSGVQEIAPVERPETIA